MAIIRKSLDKGRNSWIEPIERRTSQLHEERQMNRIILGLLGALLLSTHGYGQGFVWFSNIDQELTILKPISEIYTGDGLNSRYVAQLFSGLEGSSQSSLCPVDVPITFLDGDGAGFFVGNYLQIPGVPEGGIATLEVRVWPTEYPSWKAAADAALSSPDVRVTRSGLFETRTGSLEHPTLMAADMPRFALGTAPEPSVGALFVLGALGLHWLGSKLRPELRRGPPDPQSIQLDDR